MIGTNEIRELTLDELETVSGGSRTIQTQMTIGDTTMIIAANSDGYAVCTSKGNAGFGHCTYGH